MSEHTVEIDLWMIPLFLFFLTALYFFLLRKKIQHGHIAFSSLHLFNHHMATKTLKYTLWPQRLYLMALIFFLLACLDLRFLAPPSGKLPELTPHQIDGVSVYLAIDQSGSMEDTLINENGKRIRKMDFLKEITKEFIEKRPYDLLGLVAFARTPTIISPMTTDHTFLLQELSKLDIVKHPEQDGTAIGYAIRKIVRLIDATRYFEKQKKSAKSTKAALILITDGLQTTYPDDKENPNRTIRIESAAAEAAASNVHLYLISIDPALASEQLSAHRHMMEKSARITGGDLYIIQSPDQLKPIYDQISKIEKTTQIDPEKTSVLNIQWLRYFSFYPVFTFIALILLFIALIIEYKVLRRIPS